MYRRPIASGSVVPEAWSVSAPRRVVEHLRVAPDGPVRVLHRSTAALYLEVAGRCVGVVAPGAAQVPCALRLPGPIPATDDPCVEGGTLYLAGHPLRVGRFVDVRVPRIDPGTGRAPTIDEPAVRRLVGRGGGLTPLGDDVLCGWLAVLVASDRLTDVTTRAVRGAVDRTTLLSATLLDCALHGEVLPEFAAYVAALGTPAEDTSARALRAIGHTSGTGLWWGARHALATLGLDEAA